MSEDTKKTMKKLAKANKMTWYTEIIRLIDAKDAIIDGGTKAVADDMRVRIVKLNDKGMFAIEEKVEGKDMTTIVQINDSVLGCACDKFSKSKSHVLCRHLIHLQALIEGNKTPKLLISSPDCRTIQAYLFELGWYSENRWLYPNLDSDTGTISPVVVKELPPIAEDPLTDDGDELPPDEDSLKPDDEEKPADEPKIITRRCSYCGYVAHGEDRDKVVKDIEEHRENCPDNPKNKKVPETKEKPKKPEAQKKVVPEQQKREVGNVQEKPVSSEEEVKKPKKIVKEDKTTEKPAPKKPVNTDKISIYDWLNDLVEFAVCQIYGNSGHGKSALCRAIAVACADEGRKITYWDSEGNITRDQRDEMESHKNITYILCRDWDEIRHMLPIKGEDKTGPSKYTNTPKLKDCDVAILDSIGVPVLGEWGDMKQNEQGTALQQMQGLAYRLTKWAEKNESIVILTNQPVSAMNKTKAQIADLSPFGDKMKYFTKEILKIFIDKKTDFATICKLVTWRTRNSASGKVIATITISDAGVKITPT